MVQMTQPLMRFAYDDQGNVLDDTNDTSFNKICICSLDDTDLINSALW